MGRQPRKEATPDRSGTSEDEETVYQDADESEEEEFDDKEDEDFIPGRNEGSVGEIEDAEQVATSQAPPDTPTSKVLDFEEESELPESPLSPRARSKNISALKIGYQPSALFDQKLPSPSFLLEKLTTLSNQDADETTSTSKVAEVETEESGEQTSPLSPRRFAAAAAKTHEEESKLAGESPPPAIRRRSPRAKKAPPSFKILKDADESVAASTLNEAPALKSPMVGPTTPNTPPPKQKKPPPAESPTLPAESTARLKPPPGESTAAKKPSPTVPSRAKESPAKMPPPPAAEDSPDQQTPPPADSPSPTPPPADSPSPTKPSPTEMEPPPAAELPFAKTPSPAKKPPPAESTSPAKSTRSHTSKKKTPPPKRKTPPLPTRKRASKNRYRAKKKKAAAKAAAKRKAAPSEESSAPPKRSARSADERPEVLIGLLEGTERGYLRKQSDVRALLQVSSVHKNQYEGLPDSITVPDYYENPPEDAPYCLDRAFEPTLLHEVTTMDEVNFIQAYLGTSASDKTAAASIIFQSELWAIPLSRQSCQALGGGSRIDRGVMDFFLDLYVNDEVYERRRQQMLPDFACTSFFSSQFFDPESDGPRGFNYEAGRTWGPSEKVAGVTGRVLKDIWSYRNIYIPINFSYGSAQDPSYPSGHWYLAVIFMQAQTIELFDSKEYQYEHEVLEYRDVLSALYLFVWKSGETRATPIEVKREEWRLALSRVDTREDDLLLAGGEAEPLVAIPQQSDDADSGMFVIAFARAIHKGHSLSLVNQSYVWQFRLSTLWVAARLFYKYEEYMEEKGAPDSSFVATLAIAMSQEPLDPTFDPTAPASDDDSQTQPKNFNSPNELLKRLQKKHLSGTQTSESIRKRLQSITKQLGSDLKFAKTDSPDKRNTHGRVFKSREARKAEHAARKAQKRFETLNRYKKDGDFRANIQRLLDQDSTRAGKKELDDYLQAEFPEPAATLTEEEKLRYEAELAAMREDDAEGFRSLSRTIRVDVCA